MDQKHFEHSQTHSPRRILFLYGSQTGCAQDVAENAAREARRMHFVASVHAMDDYDRSLLIREHIVVFVASTTGQGEEPDNMKKFWKFLLRKSHAKDVLEHMEYTVLGLGDSAYIRFNWPAKKLYKRLMQLGARPFYDPAFADDQHYLGVDGTLGPWMKGLWETLLTRHPLPPHLTILSPDILFPNSFSLVFDNPTLNHPPSVESITAAMGSTNTDDHRPYPPISDSNQAMEPGMFSAYLESNQRITASTHSQDVRHIEMVIKDPVFPGYHPGDVLIVRPRNLDPDVQEFIDYNQWTAIADEPFTIRSNLVDHSLPAHIPVRQTLRTLLTNHLNVFSTPRTSFFSLLIHFTDNEDEKEKLREFVSPQGQDDLYSYSHRMKRTIFEVLNDFRGVKVQLEYLLDLFPLIMPRSFSIASAPVVNVREVDAVQMAASATTNPRANGNDISNIERPKIGEEAGEEDTAELEWRVDLCVAIVDYKTKLWKRRTGICTKWIKSMQDPSSEHPVQFGIKIQRGTLKLPKDPQTPLICIGPGTGVAPMRSFLHHRIHTQNTGHNVLFFGCRYRDRDYHYRKEWEEFERQGKMKVFAACSRDQEDKEYVQHLIKKQAPLVWKLVGHEGGVVMLSGSSNRMPTDVMLALRWVFEKEGKMSEEEAESYLIKLEKEGRFQQECWA